MYSEVIPIRHSALYFSVLSINIIKSFGCFVNPLPSVEMSFSLHGEMTFKHFPENEKLNL